MAEPALKKQLDQLLDQVPALRIPVMWARASEKQVAFAEEFHRHEDRTFASLGGNRSGKSIVGGVLCFATHLRDFAADGDVFWCVAPTQEKSVEQQKLLWDNFPHEYFDRPWDYKNGFDGQRPVVAMHLPGKRTIVVHFKQSSQDPTTFEQSAINGAWCDESMPYEIFQRLIPRTIDRRGFIIITDIPEQDWHYHELFMAPPEAKVHCVIFSMKDNAHNLPPGAIEEARGQLSKHEADMRIEGKFRRLSGVVLREFDIARHVIKPFRIPSEGPYPSITNWPRWRTMDVGGSAPNACLWIAIASDERKFVYREYYQPYGSVAKHAAAIKDMSADAWGKIEEFVDNFMDPAAWQTTPANEVNVAMQYHEQGIPFNPWPRMNEFGERAAVERIRRDLEDDQIQIFDTCTNFIRELMAWKYQLDKDGQPKASDAYENKNNHAIDAYKGFRATNPVFAVPQIRVTRA